MKAYQEQSRLFDQSEAERLKEAGRAAAVERREKALKVARQYAETRARFKATTADHVQAYLIKNGFTPEELGNAAGAIFRGPGWVCVGVRKSRRISNRSRLIRVWRFRG